MKATKMYDVDWYLASEANAEIKLLRDALDGADHLANQIDTAIEKGILDSRSAIADARLCYGEPWIYKFKTALAGKDGGR